MEKKLTGLWYSTSHRYRLITMLILVLVPASLSLLLGKKTVTFIEFFCFHSRYIDIQSKYRQVNKVKKEKNFRCKEGLLKSNSLDQNERGQKKYLVNDYV